MKTETKYQCPVCDTTLDSEKLICPNPNCKSRLDIYWAFGKASRDILKRAIYFFRNAESKHDLLKALENTNYVLLAEPDNLKALLLTGKIHFDLGNKECARIYWEKANKLQPDEPLFSKLIGCCQE